MLRLLILQVPTLAPGEGISSDHTFRLRYQLREIHVPLTYQLGPLDVGSLDLGSDTVTDSRRSGPSPGGFGTVKSLGVATTG